MLPCPLCVLQRYAFLGIALFAGLGAATGKTRPGAWAALASAVAGLLADGRARERLGRSAARRAAEFSVAAIGGRYVDLLRDVTGQPATRR
jgi:glycosyltransferase involved in cell wall biosynthesis